MQFIRSDNGSWIPLSSVEKFFVRMENYDGEMFFHACAMDGKKNEIVYLSEFDNHTEAQEWLDKFVSDIMIGEYNV